MKTQNTQKTAGYVGVDLGHKTWKACRYSPEGAHEFKEGVMTQKSIHSLAKWLHVDDTVAIENGTNCLWFKRTLQSFLSVRVILLNPLEIKQITQSLRKTDKEDAIKLAQIISKYSEEELHTVRAADEKSEYLRKLVNERKNIVKDSVRCRNRFYALCIQSGFNSVRKKDFRTSAAMEQALKHIPERFRMFAQRLIDQQKLFEAQLAQIEAECEVQLAEHQDEVRILTSMPGVGPVLALAFIAYLGDCSEFRDEGSVNYYAGLVPRLDQSGTLDRRCGIVKRGNTHLRALFINAAWALVRCKRDNAIKRFFEQLSYRVGRHKAIVATARKMLETLYVMVRRKQEFDFRLPARSVVDAA